jgi:tetratricopeptide (TPR) repeat protein
MRAVLRRLPPGLGIVLPVLLALGSHAPALVAGFVHDDGPQIRDNLLLRSLRALPLLWSSGVWAGAGSSSSFYRPLFTSSLALDVSLFGVDAGALHATQLGLFAGLVALASLVVQRLEGRRGVALAVAALFAVHPVNTEPAAWISARPELLAALTGLACVALWDAGRWRAAAAAFFLALTAKESSLVFGAALLALDRWRGRAFAPRALAARYAGLIAAGLAYAGLRTRALGSLSGGLLGASAPTDALGALGQGAARLVWPVGLTISPAPASLAHVALGVALLAAGGLALAAALRRRAAWSVPLALGLASLAVAASGAARIGEMADRYLLVPSLTAAWLAVRCVDAGASASRSGAGRAASLALGVLVVAGAVLSWQHSRVFESDATLWADAWSKSQTSVRVPLNLAAARIEAGDAAGALALLDRAEALAPGDAAVSVTRAAALERLGRRDEAERILRALVTREPGHLPAQLQLGHLALARGAPEEAAARYEAVVRAFPLAAEAWAGLGVARAQLGRSAEARDALARALALDENVQNAEALRRMLERLPR